MLRFLHLFQAEESRTSANGGGDGATGDVEGNGSAAEHDSATTASRTTVLKSQLETNPNMANPLSGIGGSGSE